MNANDFFSKLAFGATFKKTRTNSPSTKLQSNDNVEQCLGLQEKDISKSLDFFGDSAAAVEDTKGGGRIEKRKLDKLTAVDAGEKRKKRSEKSNCTKSLVTNEEEAREWRSLHKIKLYEESTLVPFPLTSIDDLVEAKGFCDLKSLTKSLEKAEYKELTPIQMQAIPIIMSNRELIACAPTGSGKSMAFLLPLLAKLQKNSKIAGFRALIISPTKELAQQILRECQKLAAGEKLKAMVLSKSNMASAKEQQKSHDILISTPMRLVHAIQSSAIDLATVKWLILDESDKLLEEGFLEQVDEIMEACSNRKLYRALFSATISSGVEALAKTFMKDPIRIVIGSKHGAAETVDQKLVYTGSEEGKMLAIRQMIIEGFKPPMLIFVQSVDRAKELFHELVYDGIQVDVIHAERSSSQRDEIIKNFRLGRIWVLIATDLMSRGVDFKGVETVINYDFPQSCASYIHRIGRTGRAGRRGTAITFFTRDDAPHLKLVCNVMKESGCEVPEWMMQLKSMSKDEKAALKKRPLTRKPISTACIHDKKERAKKRLMITNNPSKRQE